jgi:hypothetical protein
VIHFEDSCGEPRCLYPKSFGADLLEQVKVTGFFESEKDPVRCGGTGGQFVKGHEKLARGRIFGRPTLRPNNASKHPKPSKYISVHEQGGLEELCSLLIAQAETVSGVVAHIFSEFSVWSPT